jgi:four helix bundle protein
MEETPTNLLAILLIFQEGSLCELETQLIIAKELGFIVNFELYNEILELIIEESKMINAFSKSLK